MRERQTIISIIEDGGEFFIAAYMKLFSPDAPDVMKIAKFFDFDKDEFEYFSEADESELKLWCIHERSML